MRHHDIFGLERDFGSEARSSKAVCRLLVSRATLRRGGHCLESSFAKVIDSREGQRPPMDIPREREALRDLPIREDGATGVSEMTGRQLEAMADQVTGWQADELCGEGDRSRGCRKRRPAATVGEAAPRTPRLREGTYLPDGSVRPCSRPDRAMVGVVREVCVRGLSTRGTGRAADAPGFASPVPSRVSRTAADLDGEVAAPGARRLGGMALPCPWPGATHPDCRDGGHARPGGVAAAIACSGDGSRRPVGLGVAGTGPSSPRKAPPRGLRGRGVSGARCVAPDDHGGLARAIAEASPTGTTSACARATCGSAPTRRQSAGPRSRAPFRRSGRRRASWARCPWTPTRGGWGRASSTRPRPRAPPGPRGSRGPSPTTSRGGRGYAS